MSTIKITMSGSFEMAKVYKNLEEFFETTFPDYYGSMNLQAEPNLQDYIENATREFNKTVDKILKGVDETAAS
jgi:hypothetical protein